MTMTNERKKDEIKAHIIERRDKVATKAELTTLIKNFTWPNIENLLDQKLQEQADICDLRIQEWTDKKAEYLALKDEIHTY